MDEKRCLQRAGPYLEGKKRDGEKAGDAAKRKGKMPKQNFLHLTRYMKHSNKCLPCSRKKRVISTTMVFEVGDILSLLDSRRSTRLWNGTVFSTCTCPRKAQYLLN